MKRIMIVVAAAMFCLLPFGLFAQDAIDKGSLEFGLGSIVGVTFWGGDLYDPKETDFHIGSDTITVNFGYFLMDSLSLGGSLGFNSNKVEDADEASTNFFIAPVVKYYFPVNEKFLVNAKALFGFSSVKLAGFDDATSQLFFGGGAAGTYLLTPNLGGFIGVDFTYGLDSRSGGDKIDDTNSTQLDIGLGLTVYI